MNASNRLRNRYRGRGRIREALFMEGLPNGMAVVLKTTVRKDMGVRVPHPPLGAFVRMELNAA